MASEGPVIVDASIISSLPTPVVPANPKGAWGAPAMSPPVVSLAEIMSEELAKTLHIEEEEEYVKKELLIPEEPMTAGDLAAGFLEEIAAAANSPEDCANDFMIAKLLQHQFSKEYDEDLKRVEHKRNGNSKVAVTLDKYMMTNPADDSDSDDEYADLPPPKSWDSFEAHEKAFPNLGKCGYAKINNEVITKHDITMNQRRNACRVMESFPPCIDTGDAGSFDMQLSNKVYNNLKAYSKAEENRRTRHHDKKEKSTSEMAMDEKTRLLIYKLVNQTVLESVHGAISTGKEAVVLYAEGGSGEEYDVGDKKLEIPSECAVKVFKTSLNEFKTRDKYIKEDHRFKDRFSKQNPRKIIHLWAEKEMYNLNRISRAEIPCPRVVLLKKHILIMEFIGKDMRPAQKLKEVRFPTDDDNQMLLSAYQQSVDILVRLYKECKLVHADFSEYNLLWHNDKVYVIDVSQSVELMHPHALEFLHRDCTNISNFFAKKGVIDVQTPESLFTTVCGFELEGGDAEVINQIRDYEKNLELLTFAKPEKQFAFEFCWEKTKASSTEGTSSQQQPSSDSNTSLPE